MDQGQNFIPRFDKRGINFEDCEKLERTPHSIHFKDTCYTEEKYQSLKKKLTSQLESFQ